MRILVTGGTGYIGSHTTVSLLENGYDVVIADNFSNSEPWIAEAIAEITGKQVAVSNTDLCNAEAVARLFEQYNGIEGIIHFAAFKAVGESALKPLTYYRNNLVSLINLLDQMVKHSIPNLVFSSSCTVYGQPDQLPVDENAPVKAALSPYGNTKQISEEIIRDTFSVNPSSRGVSLRYFNPIGAHPSGLIGELPIGVPNNLVPFITQTAIGKRKLLKVFGNDYDTRDGYCIRDYIHVMDIASAHVAALKYMQAGKCNSELEIFNLGTGSGYSVMEVIQTFEKVSGVRLPYEVTSRRPGDVDEIWADSARANRELGWKAERSLEDMLLSSWNWEQSLANKANSQQKSKDHHEQ